MNMPACFVYFIVFTKSTLSVCQCVIRFLSEELTYEKADRLSVCLILSYLFADFSQTGFFRVFSLTVFHLSHLEAII